MYQGGAVGIESGSFITSTQWVTGGDDGSLSLWSQLKKKPTAVVHGAHKPMAEECGGHAARWVSAVATCRNSDLIASGAGDGHVKLWCAESSSHLNGAGSSGSAFKSLHNVGNIQMKGFINALALGASGQLLVAGVGQEQRWGRWSRVKSAKNGVFMTRLVMDDD